MCLVAVAMARQIGLTEGETRDVYYATLLAMAGCTASAPDDARLMGDELVLSQYLHPLFMGPPSGMALAVMRHAGEGDPGLRRVRRVVTAMAAMPARMTEATQGHCDVANLVARRLGLADGVLAILNGVFERWDGKGSPNGLRSEAIPLGARIGSLA